VSTRELQKYKGYIMLRLSLISARDSSILHHSTLSLLKHQCHDDRLLTVWPSYFDIDFACMSLRRHEFGRGAALYMHQPASGLSYHGVHVDCSNSTQIPRVCQVLRLLVISPCIEGIIPQNLLSPLRLYSPNVIAGQIQALDHFSLSYV
jgi:hypothetical protein